MNDARILETPRLRLQPVSEQHFEDLCLLFGDATVMHFINQGKGRTREETRERTDTMIRHWAEHGFGMFAVHQKDDGQFVGRCGLCYLDNTPEVELGYTLHQKFWGRGLATEASAASLQYGFEVVRLQRIIAIALPENRASRRVMEKLGFTFQGPAFYYNTDLVSYVISRYAWQQSLEARPA